MYAKRKQHLMRKLLAVLIVLAIITTTAGCLEPKEASAAMVDEGILSRLGWVQEGGVQKQTLEINVSNIPVKANTAMVVYKDKALQDRIEQETNGLVSGASSYMTTLRVVLPMGISPPGSLVFNLGEQKFMEKAREFVPDLQQTECHICFPRIFWSAYYYISCHALPTNYLLYNA
jgi:hypothetical protein